VRKTALVLAAAALLTGCANGNAAQQRAGRLSKVQYLSALEVIPAPMRAGSSAAPVEGLVISGTITNDGTSPLQCSVAEFVLVRPGGDAVIPSSQFCAVPSIAPQQSSYFNATFAATPQDDLRLRFEHGDGSYELHDLVVPPG
jgi:hypothetical protein